ncbi:MAG: hypothetical protein HC886_13635 [Leptolyngbyaceae cyanobacterium SM1_1_3]|nr:hypothetical protein [Leptolyngbyaceae cyanobacterium SM1_1_3]NJN04286.1 hypothetical protein [Leptolyngbyaceae cyanobacterium RM1_1_2]NJO08497.1 hypothetical protein [Leptolyngbyaceae cyanobacterium SL_1_1]
MTAIDSSLNVPFERLRQLRSALLQLHKALLDSEKIVYERTHGRIRSSSEFFQLVIEHEWFNWLRAISKLIVQIDEALDAKEPITLGQANSLLDNTRQLLRPLEQGTEFEKRYYQAIQRDPNIAFTHGQVSNLLSSRT